MKNNLKEVFKSNDIKVEGKDCYLCIPNSGISLKKVRDILIENFSVDIENLDEQYYICRVKVGMVGVATTVKLTNKNIEIYSFAKEGLIKQHLAKKAADRVRSVLDDGNK